MQTNWYSPLGSYPTPFNQPFFVIMNLAVGGDHLGNPTAINANSTFPGDMQVDYLFIYNQTTPLKITTRQTDQQVVLSRPSNIVCHLQPNPVNLDAGTWIDVPTTNPFFIAPAGQSAFYCLQSP
jgi:hypothetical protein